MNMFFTGADCSINRNIDLAALFIIETSSIFQSLDDQKKIMKIHPGWA